MSNSTDALAYRWNEDRATDGVPITIICPSIVLLLVALRIYTRAVYLVKKIFVEDYAIVGAMVFSIILSVFLVIAFSNGAGRHFETVSSQEWMRIRKFTPYVYISYSAAHFLLKLSIVFQYMRISVMNFEKRLCYALAAILVCGFLSFFVTSLVICRPFYAIWTPNVPGAVCVNVTLSMTATQIYFIVMDFAILIGPFFILRHLTIPWPQRILLGFVLALGAMASIVSVLRLLVIQRSTTSTDKTWDSVPSGLYGVIEINVGIACSCIVTLRPLFSRWRWLARGEPKPPPGISPAQKPPRPMDPFSVGSDSTQVLTVSDDMELGRVHAASYGGSTRAGSRAAEEHGEQTLPAVSRWESTDPHFRLDEEQQRRQTSVA
ncbi:hypothetical protein GGTG_13707 [Gaeumannomyces tritici R3-111a-1]|uniref:Rhodopsin domain-containing protein n=1 Tax=Gaeumannomyces tritici (strain R3-111a-1) TaxID=644352 RepID=J3PJM0_GAET3|nr:hypothetical protein GGTG_13707 [Gaeumannomyces tritici R3-111a-1]EJT68720.1 hypothetical protein GGTG_13707 [Gaeumannomyces tritici R3-111a-1]